MKEDKTVALNSRNLSHHKGQYFISSVASGVLFTSRNYSGILLLCMTALEYKSQLLFHNGKPQWIVSKILFQA